MQKQSTDFLKRKSLLDIITSLLLLSILGLLQKRNGLHKLGSYDTFYLTVLLATVEILKPILISRQPPFKINCKQLIKSVGVIIFFCTAIFIISILLGAPAFSEYEATLMFAALLAVLTAVPSCVQLGAERTLQMFMSLTSLDTMPFDCVLRMRLTVFGAWLGAVVVPLDWNRAWQRWPVPCCVGAIVGAALGDFLVALERMRLRRSQDKAELRVRGDGAHKKPVKFV